MAAFDFDMVGKIGSMALIRANDNDIDYNIFARLGAELRPGCIWVTSGATEIGRIDYFNRTGKELSGPEDDNKTDYAAQGQAILMENYRRFIPGKYGVRQVLLEHQHFNDPEKREHIVALFERAAKQGAIPIVNYNDPVSPVENRKVELASLRRQNLPAHECVDNDETASLIASLVHARLLVILTSAEGIYANPADPSTLMETITGKDVYEVLAALQEAETHCVGASRAGANGARAKLSYIADPVRQGTQVIIGSARHRLSDLISGKVKRTWVGVSQ